MADAGGLVQGFRVGGCKVGKVARGDRECLDEAWLIVKGTATPTRLICWSGYLRLRGAERAPRRRHGFRERDTMKRLYIVIVLYTINKNVPFIVSECVYGVGKIGRPILSGPDSFQRKITIPPAARDLRRVLTSQRGWRIRFSPMNCRSRSYFANGDAAQTRPQGRLFLLELSHVAPVDLPRPSTPPAKVWISKWIVNDGDCVLKDQIICEVESEKAIFEYPAPCDGISRQLAEPMVKLDFGDLVGRIFPTENSD